MRAVSSVRRPLPPTRPRLGASERAYHADIERGRARGRKSARRRAQMLALLPGNDPLKMAERAMKSAASLVCHHRRYYADEQYRLRMCLRARVWGALRGSINKSASTEELLGCTFAEVRAYLESTWQPGWSWANYGVEWEIDHIEPCAKFDLSDPVQQRACFYWSNLRAYPIFDNRSEGARRS